VTNEACFLEQANGVFYHDGRRNERKPQSLQSKAQLLNWIEPFEFLARAYLSKISTVLFSDPSATKGLASNLLTPIS